ncbi:MAG: hypothetical protein P8X55_03540 [Desulfosarcinaceae bacterium]
MADKQKRRSAAQVLVWLPVLFLLAGCGATYATLQTDDQVKQGFKNYEMIDGYHYYYSGRENLPSAIIGLDPAYRFSSEYWTAIPSSQFKREVNRLQMAVPNNSIIYGAYIIAPDGKRVGVWYSWVENFTAKVEGDRIIVYSPEPFAERGGMGMFERDPDKR